jgi:lipopolysaccharide export system protein LptA
MRPITASTLFAASFLILNLAGPSIAFAEKADRNKPIVADADKLTLDNAKKVSIFEGNVVITQGSMKLTGDKVVIREDKDGFRFATGTGNPCTFREKRDGVEEYVDGHSLRFEYNGKTEVLELFEKAELQRGKDNVKGEYISYDTRSEFFRVNGNASKEPSGAGRVHAVIQPAPQTPAPAEKH